MNRALCGEMDLLYTCPFNEFHHIARTDTTCNSHLAVRTAPLDQGA